MPAARLVWAPAPYRAGFCITDDTDAATLPAVRAVYETLLDLGLTATIAVWPFTPDESCGVPATPPSTLRGVTLDDPETLAYMRELAARGVELVPHGASAGNNRRERTLAALDFVEAEFGAPRVWICHSKNAENPYWEQKVAPNVVLRRMLALYSRHRTEGEVPCSPYFWGDVCRRRRLAIRLFRTRRTNTLAADPAMPYHEVGKPFVAEWFSATKRSFHDGTTPAALDRLAAEHGLTVLYQYLHRYGRPDGSVARGFRANAERLAADARIWTPTVGDALDRLRQMQGVMLAHRGADLWIGNVREAPVRDVQLRLPPGVAADADGTSMRGDVLVVDTLAPGALLRVRPSRRVRVAGRTTVRVRRDGRARRRLGLATATLDTAAGTCRLVGDAGHEADPPLSVPGQFARTRLFAGQFGIIARELALRKRPLDPEAFLGADTIPLEDHANW